VNQMELAQLQRSAGMAVAQSREALAAAKGMSQEHQVVRRELAAQAQQLKSVVDRLEIMKGGGNPDIQRIENIPGRRVPFDLLVDISVKSGSTDVVEGSIPISQEGPFVALSRMATCLSAYQFQYTDPSGTQVATFQGRSFGRFRPIHSAWDLNDGQPYNQIVLAAPPNFPGNGAPYTVSPPNASPWRSMQSDFRIRVEDAGSSFPRSNIPVPSTWWTKSINEPWELAALDFFERGSVITFKLQPLHPNNPAYGNLSGYNPANANFPFLDSQWDGIEGIDDRVRVLNSDNNDPIVRVANLVVTIGFHGYRIIQQPGVGPS